MSDSIKYHEARPKGPWDWIDWTLVTVGCLNTAFLVVMVVWALYDWPKPSAWVLVPLIGGFVIPGMIAVFHNRDFCDRHGCEMEGWCPQCSREQREEKDRIRLAAEREVRIEEIAEGYRRAQEGILVSPETLQELRQAAGRISANIDTGLQAIGNVKKN